MISHLSRASGRWRSIPLGFRSRYCCRRLHPGVAHNYGFRSGGFVGAAFIAMLLGDPWQVAIAVAIAGVTYLIVSKFLMDSMILFGRRKFSAMLLISSSIAWSLLWVGTELFDLGAQKHLELGSLALTPLFVPGLIANDTQRTGPRRVLFGVVMATTFVLTSTWWIQSLFEELVLAPVWKFVSVASFAAIFWRQFVPSRSEARADVAADATNAELAANALPGSATAYDQAAFERWGTVHREEAEAAERWLTVVADEQPKPAIAGDGGTPRLDRASGPEPEQRPTERIRRAAIQALNSPGELPSEQERQSDQEPAIAQLAADPRLASPEFDEIAADIAASVGRPHPLPRRRPAKPTTSTGSATPQEAGSLPGGDPTNQISEHPGAATRAHTIAAPGARTTQADTDREKGTTSTVFPE